MSTLFISDIHLCTKKPKIVSGFLNFLHEYAIYAKSLYILGDLFETWLGDDDLNPLNLKIAKALQKLNKKNIPCYFIHGNHDFLLGKKYAYRCGMILLPEKKILKLSSGKKLIILHGDILCTNDISYCKFKKFVNHRLLQHTFLSLPLFIRHYIYKIIKLRCNHHNQYKLNKEFDINHSKIISMLTNNKANIMIHGHTHKMAVHNIYDCKYNLKKRLVLGAWKKNGSMIEITHKNEIKLIEFPLKI